MRIFRGRFRKFGKIDILIVFIIMFIYGLFSFYKLGNFSSPNTFYYNKDRNSVIVDLKKISYVNKIRLFNGYRAAYYSVSWSNDGEEYTYLSSGRNKVFNWIITDVALNTRYLKFDFDGETSVGEIGIYNNDKLYNVKIYDDNNNIIKELSDESSLIPKTRSYMNSMYFDEIYFARTAYEYVYNLKTYEWTHPPLGKIIQAIPIYITHNMSPFNYRLMGNISGILLVVVMYLFGTVLCKNRKYGILAALLMSFDTFHFAHTRMGTVDSHLVLFITLSVFFMYLFTKSKKNYQLFLSGLFFALSVSVKWTGAYAGFPLAIIYFAFLFENKLFNIKYILLGFLYFVIIPIVIYVGVFLIFSNNFYVTDNFLNIIKENIKMYDYHSKLNATHNFSSKWYTWPISYRPVWYHYATNIDKVESITGVGNIIIWYSGIIAFFYCLVKYFIKLDNNCILLVITILCLWLPYAFINRIMFLYHFFPVLPFLFLGVSYFLCDLDKKFNLKYIMYGVLFLSYCFFVLYYPVVSGMEVKRDYLNRLEIFESWYFA